MRFLALAMIGIFAHADAWAEVLTFDCRFLLQASPEGLNETSEPFHLVFRLDDVTGDAFLEGNNALTGVHPFLGSKGITFLEVLETGAVQATTIA